MSLAFTFPGQGSQSVGMLSALGDHYQSVEETFTEAADVLGVDLWSIVRDGPEDALNQTEITQPAMLAAGFAIWRVWKSEGGPDPRFMAGHSLGEYTALLCAEALDYPSALRLVAGCGARSGGRGRRTSVHRGGRTRSRRCRAR